MTTIIVPTWLAWTLAILIGLPMLIFGIVLLALLIAVVASSLKNNHSGVKPFEG